MKSKLLVIGIIAIIALSGCLQGDETGAGQEQDLCEGVICEPYCEGTTYYTDPYCAEGKCAYTLEYDSPMCMDIPEPEPAEPTPQEPEPTKSEFDLQITQRICKYLEDFDRYEIFFTIKNLATNAPPEGGSIWLIGDEVTNKPCHQIQNRYGLNQIFWGEVHHTGYTWQGQFWSLTKFPEEKDFDYKLVYCPNVQCLTAKLGDCNEANGEVWYEGNTSLCELDE